MQDPILAAQTPHTSEFLEDAHTCNLLYYMGQELFILPTYTSVSTYRATHPHV